MSLFDEAGNQPDPSDKSNKDGEPNQGFLEKLVAEKGDHWKDPEVLAKGKLESDSYIEKLRQENEALKAKAIEGEVVEQLMLKLEERAGTPSSPNPSNPDPNNARGEEDDTNPTKPEDIQKLVETMLSQREAQSIQERNLSEVTKFMEDNYGASEASRVVAEKAREKGLSVVQLQDLAKTSPAAFYALVGEAPKRPNPRVQGDINTEGVHKQTNQGVRDWQYYQKLRRENPKLYRSWPIQQQLFADKQALGDAFGN